mmetsp:Transcript_83209/g.269372  ORF Transcript_83209/g.269372 Transcript_83209/m.269372 type:complete len:279 (+) Transcript_83209:134-970(+)
MKVQEALGPREVVEGASSAAECAVRLVCVQCRAILAVHGSGQHQTATQGLRHHHGRHQVLKVLLQTQSHRMFVRQEMRSAEALGEVVDVPMPAISKEVLLPINAIRVCHHWLLYSRRVARQALMGSQPEVIHPMGHNHRIQDADSYWPLCFAFRANVAEQLLAIETVHFIRFCMVHAPHHELVEHLLVHPMPQNPIDGRFDVLLQELRQEGLDAGRGPNEDETGVDVLLGPGPILPKVPVREEVVRHHLQVAVPMEHLKGVAQNHEVRIHNEDVDAHA